MKYHDLSANVVKLDYPTLLRTAKIAVGATKNEMERRLSAIQSSLLYTPKEKSMQLIDVESLVSSAQAFTIALETMHALEAMESREEIEWANLPKVRINH